MEIRCRKCFEGDLFGQELGQVILDYVQAIEEEYRTESSIYQERLEKCDTCDALMNGICKHCGCFVLARAAKKTQKCPYPLSGKWLR